MFVIAPLGAKHNWFANLTCYLSAMTIAQTQELIAILQGKGVKFEMGLTDDEVLKIESVFSVIFPPDFKLFLQTALPVSKQFVNWRRGIEHKDEAAKIFSRISGPWEGMLFDVAVNNYWNGLWGEKPGTNDDKVTIAKKHYYTYPILIPVYSHRYIPANPSEAGNPIFSVVQMDIIYYGYNLATYLANEFYFALPENFESPEQPKQIEFWSDCVE